MFCSRCGNKTKEGGNFCHACGNKIAAATYAAPPQSKPPRESLEQTLGLNVINKIGICFIIIGAIAAAAHPALHAGVRAVFMFLLGAAMVGAGELLSRRNRNGANVFSLGMTAGGVAVTYVALSVSYFYLEVFPLYVAALLCAVITAGAFFLSRHYDSQVIATFMVIGGFVPMFFLTVEDSYALTFSLMAYFLVLSILALSLSLKRMWMVTAFFGLILNLLATLTLSASFSAGSPSLYKGVFVLYIAVSFIIYAIIPVIGAYKQNTPFRKSDLIVLISVNTLCSWILLNYMLDDLFTGTYRGLSALGFAIFFGVLWRLAKTKMPAERGINTLFFILSAVFLGLVLPHQFGAEWFTSSMIIIGTVLATHGIIKTDRRFKITGLGICGVALLSFLTFDLDYSEYFLLKYAVLTLASLVIMGAYAYKRQNTTDIKVLKHFIILNLWFYLLYLVYRLFDDFVDIGSRSWLNYDYLISVSMIAATFLAAFIALRIKRLSDLGMKITALILYCFGLLWLFGANFALSPIEYYYAERNHETARYVTDAPAGYAFVATIIIIAISVLSTLALYDGLKYFVKKSSNRDGWLSFYVSLYLTIILTQSLNVFFDVPFAGMAISLVLAVFAVACCVFGFVKRFTFMRRFGLGVALAVAAKVFLLDLWLLTEGYRIIVFFGLGISLIAISFVYQYFTKRIGK